jgi:uncharacterized protein YecT (DUF1311 family)
MRATALVPVLFIFVAHGVSSATPFQCKPDGLQQEMNACSVRDYKAADTELNAKYKAVLAGLPPPKQLQLRKEQRAWLRRRDSQCKEEVKLSEGGSIWPLEYFSCLSTITQRRTAALKSWERNP